MFSKNALVSLIVALARRTIGAANAALAAYSKTEVARARLNAFKEKASRLLKKWDEQKASYIALVIKVVVTYATDLVLLEPLALALGARILPGVTFGGYIVAVLVPVPVILIECAIAVRYARAKEWEARFGTNHDAKRWLFGGLFVATIPSTVVLALGALSTATAAVLGWPALIGRQALNVVLAVVSISLHILLVLSGETPKDAVRVLLAVLGATRRQRAITAAETAAIANGQTAIALATRYEAARLEHDSHFAPMPVYPFPESVIALIRRDLPNFARPRTASDMSFIPIDPEPDGDDATLH
jgi:hypothetical protein